MRTKLLCLFVVLCTLLFDISSVKAQGLTTVAISGTVTDGANALVGTTIVATQMASGTKYTAKTGEKGRFSLPGMRVGMYKIDVSRVGFQTQVVTNVSLTLGQDVSLDFLLKEASNQLNEVVVITATKFKGIKNVKNGVGVTIGNEAISQLPTVSRSIGDFTRLLPQAGSQGLMGKGAKSNNLTVDGASFNNFMGLGSEASGAMPGGNVGAQPFSLDALDQIAVQASPYDVNVGGFTGAGVNVVTKSGDNTFRASVYNYYRNQSFVGKQIGDASLNIPSFTENTTGFRVGGPIVKNKLFFFTNFEYVNSNTPLSNIVAKRNGLSGANVSNIDAASMDQLSNFLVNNYGYHPGAYEGVQGYSRNYKFLVKLDWNINDKNKFSIRYNQLQAQSLNGTTASNLTALNFSNLLYTRNNNIYGLSAELNSKISSALSNRFITSYTSLPDYRSPFAGKVFPLVNITDNSNKVAFGTDPASNLNRIDQKVFQIQDDITYLSGKHKLTAGANWQYLNLSNNFTFNPQGTFSFASMADFYNSATIGAQTPNGISTGLGRPSQYTTNYTVQPGRLVTLSNPKISQLGLYLQDEINFSPRFTLSGGVRFDIISLINKPNENPNVSKMDFQWANGNEFKWATTNTPNTKVLFSPRVGFNWFADKDKNLNIKGGIGMFTGVIPFTYIDKIYSINGTNEGSINATGANAANYPFSPEAGKYKPLNASVPPPSYELDLVDKNFKMPQTLRSSLNVNYRFPYHWTAGIEGVYSKDFNTPYYENVNLNQRTSLVAADGRTQFASRQINSAVTGAYLLRNVNMGSQVFLTVNAQKIFSNGLQVSMSYTHGLSKSPYELLSTTAAGAFNAIPVATNPNIPTLSYAAFDLRNRIVVNANHKFNYGHWATSVGMFFNAAQQGRSSYTYAGTGDLNKDGVQTNDLIFVPRTLSDINLVPYTLANKTVSVAEQWNALNTNINNSTYLNSRRGKFAERNGLLNPWYAQLDLHLGQELKLIKSNNQRIEFTIDILNLGNMLNKNWGIIKAPSSTSPIMAGPNGTYTVNVANLQRPEFVPYINTASAWSMMFGLRYSFN